MILDRNGRIPLRTSTTDVWIHQGREGADGTPDVKYPLTLLSQILETPIPCWSRYLKTMRS